MALVVRWGTPTGEHPMAKPNYQFEKRQREQQKKQKKVEKAQRKALPAQTEQPAADFPAQAPAAE